MQTLEQECETFEQHSGNLRVPTYEKNDVWGKKFKTRILGIMPFRAPVGRWFYAQTRKGARHRFGIFAGSNKSNIQLALLGLSEV